MRIKLNPHKRMPYVVLVALLLASLACGNFSGEPIPTDNPSLLQTMIVGTAVAADMQTLTASAIISPPLPTNTSEQTNTPLPDSTDTPIGPISLMYEGVTVYCTCVDCVCLTNQVFIVRITIDPQGNITGELEKYLPQFPPITLTGVKTSILGLVQDDKNSGNFLDFNGYLSEDLKTLNAILSFRGPDGTGKRELLFHQK